MECIWLAERKKCERRRRRRWWHTGEVDRCKNICRGMCEGVCEYSGLPLASFTLSQIFMKENWNSSQSHECDIIDRHTVCLSLKCSFCQLDLFHFQFPLNFGHWSGRIMVEGLHAGPLNCYGSGTEHEKTLPRKWCCFFFFFFLRDQFDLDQNSWEQHKLHWLCGQTGCPLFRVSVPPFAFQNLKHSEQRIGAAQRSTGLHRPCSELATGPGWNLPLYI